MEEKLVMFQFGGISRLLKKYSYITLKSKGVDDIAMIHGYIIHYLEKNKDKDVYQKDIEKELKVAKSYVTGILKSFEEKGWIKRETNKNDARLKKITLTEEGEKLNLIMKTSFEEIDNSIRSILTKEEMKQLTKIIEKIETKAKEEINA